ncbi:MAG: hypothetical protein Tsb009_27650 [Planctomycetaceae bacterium]
MSFFGNIYSETGDLAAMEQGRVSLKMNGLIASETIVFAQKCDIINLLSQSLSHVAVTGLFVTSVF